MKKAHLMGYVDTKQQVSTCSGFLGSIGTVKCSDIKKPNELKYDGKSETWSKDKLLVKRMLGVINSENTHAFHIAGRNSIFAKPMSAHAMMYVLEPSGHKDNSYSSSVAIMNAVTNSMKGQNNAVTFLASIAAVVAWSLVSAAISKAIQPAYNNLKTSLLSSINTKRDNCFTWAREMLKIADIYLPYFGHGELLFTSTRQVTNPGEFKIKLC